MKALVARRLAAVVGVLLVAPWIGGMMTAAPATTVAQGGRFLADAWYLADDDLLGFVEIPAGPFSMGSDRAVDPLAYDNERWSVRSARGSVDLPAFFIGRYEVTVGQFRAFVEASGYRADRAALQGAPEHPVTSVSWPDALAYAAWLEQELEGSAATPSSIAAVLRDGWRVGLPSEAEWEKAARGTDARTFPWGNDERVGVANYRATAAPAGGGVAAAGFGPVGVGSFACPDCAFGIADMAGNVWELTRSPYQPYPYDDADDREGLGDDALFVMRGGHFGDGAQNVRTTVRGRVDPGARRPFIGFRLVISRF